MGIHGIDGIKGIKGLRGIWEIMLGLILGLMLVLMLLSVRAENSGASVSQALLLLISTLIRGLQPN